MFVVKVLSPNKVYLNGVEVLSIKAPAFEGQLNILPGHTHIIARMVRGILLIESRGEGLKKYYVESGLCRVLRGSVVFMIKGVITPEEVNLEQLKSEWKILQNKISGDLGYLNQQQFSNLENQLNKLEYLIQLKSHS